jgi:AcrR family transcriptional regulator
MSGLADRAPAVARRRPVALSRAELVEAAARVFATNGYEGASIQDVAEALGLLKGSLYYYIDSKEDLLFWIVEEMHDDFQAVVERTRAAEGGALGRVRTFVSAHAVQITEDVLKAKVFFQDFHRLSDDRRQAIIRRRDEYEAFLAGLLEAARAEGAIRDDVDLKLAVTGILGMTNWIYTWYRPGGRLTPRQIGEAYAELAVSSLRPR